MHATKKHPRPTTPTPTGSRHRHVWPALALLTLLTACDQSPSPPSSAPPVAPPPPAPQTKYPNTEIPNQSAFFDACAHGDAAAVAALLEKTPNLVHARDGNQSGQTPLHVAAFHNHANIINVLATHGAELEIHDGQYDSTPLGWAVYAGSKDAAQALIAQHAKIGDWMLGMADDGIHHRNGQPGKPADYQAIITLLKQNGAVDPADYPFPKLLRADQDAALPTAPAWNLHPADPTNQIAQLLPVGLTATADPATNTLICTAGESEGQGLLLPAIYHSPVKITVVAKTDDKNLRLYFGKGAIILNWENNPDQLRFHDFVTGQPTGIDDQGDVRKDKFCTIVWTVTPDQTRLLVNDEERMAESPTSTGNKKCDVTGRIGLAPAWGSTLTVQSVTVEPLP